MSKEINIKDPLRYLAKGERIARAFKEVGLTTNQSIAIMNLYQRDYLRKELMNETEIKNEGQFSRDVIMPLKVKGYIEYVELPSKKIRIAQKGKGLVEEVLKELGY